MRGERGPETVQEQTAVRITRFHLGLECPPEVFEMRIAQLKAIDHLHMCGIQS
jgi:hypothetical protein